MTVLLGALAGAALAFAAVAAAERLLDLWPRAFPSPVVLAVAAALGAVAGARAEAAWPALAWWFALSLPFAVTALTDATDNLVFPLALAPLAPMAPLLRADEGWGAVGRALAAALVFFAVAGAVGTVASLVAGNPEQPPLGFGDILAAGAIGLTFGFGGGVRVLLAGMLLAAAVAAWMLLRRREPGQTMPYAACLCVVALVALAMSEPA